MVSHTTEETVDEAVAPSTRITSRRRAGAAWIVTAALVGLLLGTGLGLLVPRLSVPGEDSPEAGFARDMSTHHAQAVEMGMIAHAKASNSDVRFFGRDIALTQQGQIGMMQGWLRQWHLDPTGSQPPMTWMADGADSVRNGLMPGMATPAEMQQLRDATGEQVDLLFLRLMQQHHLGGIHMAQEIVKLSDESEVDELAQLAINGQQRELTDLRSLRERLQKSA